MGSPGSALEHLLPGPAAHVLRDHGPPGRGSTGRAVARVPGSPPTPQVVAAPVDWPRPQPGCHAGIPRLPRSPARPAAPLPGPPGQSRPGPSPGADTRPPAHVVAAPVLRRRLSSTLHPRYLRIPRPATDFGRLRRPDSRVTPSPRDSVLEPTPALAHVVTVPVLEHAPPGAQLGNSRLTEPTARPGDSIAWPAAARARSMPGPEVSEPQLDSHPSRRRSKLERSIPGSNSSRPTDLDLQFTAIPACHGPGTPVPRAPVLKRTLDSNPSRRRSSTPQLSLPGTIHRCPTTVTTNPPG